MRHCKIKAILFIVCIAIGLFIKLDRDRYFIGKSCFDYKLLPYGLQPKYYSHSYKNENRVKYEFQIIANGFEGYGEGTSCFCNKDREGSFTIKRIEGYYYGKETFFALCLDNENKKHYITPFVNVRTKDILLIEANVSKEELKRLRYVKVPEPVSVKEYYENYNYFSRILMWLTQVQQRNKASIITPGGTLCFGIFVCPNAKASRSLTQFRAHLKVQSSIKKYI